MDEFLALYKQYCEWAAYTTLSFNGFMQWLERRYWSVQTVPPIKPKEDN